jgi:hypothetical protein
MQPRACMLTAAVLNAAMAFGVAAMAADLPKEGTFSGTFSGFNTNKATTVGKEWLLVVVDDNGLTVGNGFLDHATWHCSGLYPVANGMAQWNGYCAVTSPSGDQIVTSTVSDAKFPADAKSYSLSGTFITGTGKYAGISGGWTGVFHGPDFRTPAEGTYTEYGEMKGSYKLP